MPSRRFFLASMTVNRKEAGGAMSRGRGGRIPLRLEADLVQKSLAHNARTSILLKGKVPRRFCRARCCDQDGMGRSNVFIMRQGRTVTKQRGRFLYRPGPSSSSRYPRTPRC